jgi:hypothetical protein
MFALLRILRAWLGSDRIRISPQEAKLLRLTPGACICIGGVTYTVESRTVGDPSCATVAYHCRGIDAEMDLIATIAEDGTIQARTATGNSVKWAPVEEIECFG